MAVVILDGNYQVCRAVHAGSTLRNEKGVETGGVYRFLRTMWSIKEMGRIVCVFDGSRSQYRKNIYPEYKERKKEVTEETLLTRARLDFTYKTLKDLLPAMNIPVVQLPDQEGDDVIFRLAQIFKERDEEAYVISDDHDLVQLVNIGARLYKPMKNEHWNEKNIEHRLGFDPKYFVIYKSLIGDPSDNIKGVKGVGEKRAKQIVTELEGTEYKHIQRWFEKGDTLAKKKVKENFPILKRNILLIDIDKVPLDKGVVETFYEDANFKANLDIDHIDSVFNELGFKSLTNWKEYLLKIWRK